MEPIVRKFVKSLHEKVRWPSETQITPDAQKSFRRAERILDTYEGNSATLVEAIKVCLTGNCRPYAFAAASTAIRMLSFRDASEYDIDGLVEALRWLERAQRDAPDRPEIDIGEVTLYICLKRYADARKVLDHIARHHPDFHGIPRAEMWYWETLGDHAQWLMWSRRALDLARDDHERFYALNVTGSYYLSKQMLPEALATLKKAAGVNPSDAWVWHSISVVYMNLRQYAQAHEANAIALKLRDFEAARDVELQLKAKRGLFGGWKKA